MVYVLILLGAGIGGVVRYWLSNLNTISFMGHVPMGTLLANIVGSGCLAWGVVRLGVVGNVSGFCFEEGVAWAFILVGASGGLSTFSLFTVDWLMLASHPLVAFFYVIGSVLVALLGFRLAGHLMANSE